MRTCLSCGQILPSPAWNGLTVTSFGDVFFRGIKRLSLSPTEAAILAILTVRGQASHFSLDLLTPSSNGNSVKVLVSYIRKKLSRAEVPIVIKNIRGFGYELVLL